MYRVIKRTTWFEDTLNAYESELLLKLQPDNILKLPSLKASRVSMYTSDILHTVGLTQFVKSLAGPLGIKPAPLNIKAIRDTKSKQMISFHLYLFPHHRNLSQLIWFFFALRIRKNRLLLIPKGAYPNEVCFKVKGLDNFSSQPWNSNTENIPWGQPLWISLLSPNNIDFFAPLFKMYSTSIK